MSMEWAAGCYDDVIEMMGSFNRSRDEIALLLRISKKELNSHWNKTAYDRGIELNKMYLMRKGLEQSGKGNSKILETFLSHALGIDKKEAAPIKVTFGNDVDGSYKLGELNKKEIEIRYSKKEIEARRIRKEEKEIEARVRMWEMRMW